MALSVDQHVEWLETDGRGGFASGTVTGIRTRRYHAVLLVAATPPTGRVLLVNGFEAWIETPAGTFALSSQAYPAQTIYPDGAQRLVAFTDEPWPRWTFTLEDGTGVEQELFVSAATPVVALSWRLRAPQTRASLTVRPLLSGRDYHALHHENPHFHFDAAGQDERVLWHPYPDLPGIVSLSNGTYTHQPDWYRNFFYSEEQTRGLDHTEDLASPGALRWDLSQGEAIWLLAAETQGTTPLSQGFSAATTLQQLRIAEQQRRQRFPSRLHRAADAYLVQRGTGQTIVAGYPWFTDWGRDTFIALRGLCLATGRLAEAQAILLEWAGAVSAGMLPNRFADHGDTPEFNAVDASLWYIVAVYEFCQAMQARKLRLAPTDQQRLQQAIEAILSGYAGGTRYGIRLDDDGLLAAGERGVQLTWMDAKVGDWVVTPRIGKPVEVEALWLNALWIGSHFSERWAGFLQRGREAFQRRFWHEAGGYLCDVVDPDHQPGTADTALRPNQIFAVGGLPLALLDGEPARRVVEAVEARLWTPLGLRSLAPGEPGYTPRYEGGVRERDGAYHQGTVWPWLLGPFVEAWVRVHGNTVAAKKTACTRYLTPILHHLDDAGHGHISEIVDAEPPHTPRGCPFQAWSVGEALRLGLVVLTSRGKPLHPFFTDNV
jgi:predicted glycogen debranching enzyme